MLQPFPADLRILNTVSTVLGAQDSLEAINTNTLMDRALVSCSANNLIYQLRKDSVAAPSLPNTVAPVTGPGRWIAYATGGASSLPLPSVLYVDPTLIPATTRNGSIEAPFATLLAALQALPGQGGTVLVCASLAGTQTIYNPLQTQQIQIIGAGAVPSAAGYGSQQDLGDFQLDISDASSTSLSLQNCTSLAAFPVRVFSSSAPGMNCTLYFEHCSCGVDCDDTNIDQPDGLFVNCGEFNSTILWTGPGAVRFNGCTPFALTHSGGGQVYVTNPQRGVGTTAIIFTTPPPAETDNKVLVDSAGASLIASAEIAITNGNVWGIGRVPILVFWALFGSSANIPAGTQLDITLNVASITSLIGAEDEPIVVSFYAAPPTPLAVVGSYVDANGTPVITVRNFDIVGHTVTNQSFSVSYALRNQ
jgi:hypothetical protein